MEKEKKKVILFSNIGSKLIIPYLIISFLTFVLIVGLIYYNYNVQINSIKEVQEEISIKASSAIQYYVESILKELNLIRKNIFYDGDTSQDNKKILKNLMDEDPSIYEISIISKEGKEINKIIRYKPRESLDLKDVSTQEKFKEAIKGEYYLGHIYISEYGIPFIPISLPIVDKNNIKIGVLSAEVDLSPMWDTVSKIKAKKTGYVYVVDRDGKLIAYKDINLIKKKLDLRYIQGVKNFLAHIHKSEIYTSINNQKVVGNWKAIEATGWGLIVELPLKEIHQELSVLLFVSSISFIAFFSFIIIILIIIFKKLLVPISYLRVGVTEVRSGNLNYKVKMVSEDEIGELASAFNQMTEDLQKTTVSRDELIKEITERKRAEEEYRMILRTTIDGFWITDMQGRFLDVNDAYCRLIGYSRDELLKMKIPDIEAVERPEETAQRIQKIMTTGGDRLESRHRCKDGKIVDIEVSVNYTKEGGGRLFVFLRDITERKKIKEQQGKLMKELEELNRIMTGRELRMIELKEEINKLNEELGRPAPYGLSSIE